MRNWYRDCAHSLTPEKVPAKNSEFEFVAKIFCKQRCAFDGGLIHNIDISFFALYLHPRIASMRVFSLLTVLSLATVYGNDDEEELPQLTDAEVGPRDRFWRHHVTTKSLIHEGVEQYGTIQSCLDELLNEEEKNAIRVQSAEGIRHVGTMIAEENDEDEVFLVHVQKAILPVHVKAIQSLASCVRQALPHHFECRPMYQEWNLDEDPGLGGNCPTHLVPLVGIFFPEVLDQMQQTLEFAYEAAGWEGMVLQDRKELFYERTTRIAAMHAPDRVGIRASEHLTYRDFPTLADHSDGVGTIYTMNYAFSDDYEGGEFYILSKEDPETGDIKRHVIKPQKYDALVFLGGRYLHGVQEITGGTREMFSTEFWAFPDSPFGTSLWTNDPINMEQYVRECNDEMKENNSKDIYKPCTREFPTLTSYGIELKEVRQKYGKEQSDVERRDLSERPNRVRPQPLTPIRFRDDSGREYDLDDFRPVEDEPDFLIPKKLEPGEMVPIRWRETLDPVDGDEGETFVIGFPPELHQEFLKYVEKSGMMNVARKILYEEEELVPGEHRIYTLDDGHKWGAMIQGSWNTDMVWLDPADEECFESLLSVLRRGGFDKVLDRVGRSFDLQGLMIQGVGAIFLTEYEVSENMHVDIVGSKGSFYNIIVPVHIPVNQQARFYVANAEEEESRGITNLDPNVGIVLGGESPHGTGECNYRGIKDFRLSFAIYVADINADNVELIASDSTSLWPTQGDIEWFVAQRGRLWSKDGSTSLKNDKGRKSMKVDDLIEGCTIKECESDPQGKRLKCPRTCRLYLNDEDYYSLLENDATAKAKVD